MLKRNNFITKQKGFWTAKIASILLATGLCFGLAGQRQIVHAEAPAPQTEENSQQPAANSNNTCPNSGDLLGKNQTPTPSSPNISSTKKDFTDQIPSSHPGVGVPVPNNNYHFTNSPSTPGFSEGKVANPDNPVLTGEAPNINLNEQNADLGNIAAEDNQSKKIKSDSVQKQSEATETNKTRDTSSEQSTKSKHQKVYYANIFQAKETSSNTKKANKREQKKDISGLTAEVINRKGQKVGYVDKHDRVHLEKLSYSGKMDSPSLTIGLVSLLAAGLLTTIGFTNSKKRI